MDGRGSGLPTASPAAPPVMVDPVQLGFGLARASGVDRRAEGFVVMGAAVGNREVPAADVDGLHDAMSGWVVRARPKGRFLERPSGYLRGGSATFGLCPQR